MLGPPVLSQLEQVATTTTKETMIERDITTEGYDSYRVWSLLTQEQLIDLYEAIK